MAKGKERKFEPGSTNVFADVGYKNPEEAFFKAELIREINHLIKKKRLTQVQAAKLLGTQQSKISDLSRGLISGFSAERLLRYLQRLHCDIEVRLHPRRPSKRGPTLSVRVV